MIPLLALHLTGGSLAIASGLLALCAAKGATLHRKSGTIFAYAMFSMSLTGAAVMAAGGRTSSANLLAGLLTTYLVTTALTTVSERSERVQKLDHGAMVAAVTFGVVSMVSALGILAAGPESSRGLAFVLLIVGGIALPAGLADRRMIRAGALRGRRRLARHLWRMCFALFIVVASFVLGRRFPEALRILPIRLIPLGVLLSMFVWLWRLRRRSTSDSARITAGNRLGSPDSRFRSDGHHDVLVSAGVTSEQNRSLTCVGVRALCVSSHQSRTTTNVDAICRANRSDGRPLDA